MAKAVQRLKFFPVKAGGNIRPNTLWLNCKPWENVRRKDGLGNLSLAVP